MAAVEKVFVFWEEGILNSEDRDGEADGPNDGKKKKKREVAKTDRQTDRQTATTVMP
jgi:hypothetical protein